jgi:hypothetical protein
MQKIVPAHNHYLASPNMTCKLRSQRHVIEVDRQLIAQIREAGTKPTKVYDTTIERAFDDGFSF